MNETPVYSDVCNECGGRREISTREILQAFRTRSLQVRMRAAAEVLDEVNRRLGELNMHAAALLAAAEVGGQTP